ncbi:MAG: mechanosensitive ion channel [Rhodobacteraceae bacterium]|nr:mechanosensitive ion channel [Paracoccaceae bacterium]
MRHLLICLCVLAGSAWPALSVAQGEAQPGGTIAVEDSAAQDAAIANRIRDILAELEGYGDITVTVNSGIVTLRGTTLDSAAAQRLNDLVGRVQGVVAIRNEIRETTDVVERLNPAVERFRARVVQFVAFLPLFLVALAVAGVITLAGLALARLAQPWNRLAPNAFIADIYRQILRLAFIVAALVVALDILGATALLSTILGAAGIAGLAIGFAVRDTVENFIASILLSVRQPFRPNDLVEIEGDTGKVIRLTSRATILLSLDGNHIRIPNATVFKARIVNYSRNDELRFVFDLGVAPDTDLARARELAETTVQSLPFTLTTPAPSAWVQTIGDSTITLRVTGWIAQKDTSVTLARSEAIRLTLLAFDKAGIAMPEPGFRLIGGPPAGASVRPTAATPPSEAETAVQDVAATAEAELESMVSSERATLKGDDLLNHAAPEE